MMWFMWAAVVGIPAAALFAAIMWPQPIPPDRTVEAIRQRVESERRREAARRGRRRPGYY
ncbi:hypothetical protein [Nocardia asteroides]|uniref:hypothetical protein n=1 Tax=Nocardia asteroides TaxID=1824 RepID=UPI003439B556